MNLLGVEIGGTKLQLVLGDEAGNIRRRRRLAVTRDAGADGIRRKIEGALPEIIGHDRVEAVGIGFGGPVDWRTGRVCRSHQIEGWTGFELAAWLHTLTGAVVHADNDGNVAALAEARRGAGRDFDPVFYVTMGSGVGGGLVTGGGIYHGDTPGEAEIGHVRLDRSGTTVESRCSGWALDARIRELKSSEAGGRLARLIGEEHGAESRHLATALKEGDPTARRLLIEFAEDLAFGLSHVTHLFHPQTIILGGGLAGLGEDLRQAVEDATRQFVMTAFAPGPVIRLTALGEDVVPVGALLLAAMARGTR